MKENRRSNISAFFTIVGIFLLLTTFGEATGLDGLKTIVGDFATDIIAIASAIIVIAIIWAGFKVAFGAGWADVSNVVMGSLIIGSAGIIAGLLLGDSGVAIVTTT